MTLPGESSLQRIQFYASSSYACGYLPGKLAQSLIATPHHLIDSAAYSGLIQLGFRRSGKFAYRPHCEHCNACIAVRLPVAEFKPSRSQRRAWKQHQSLSTRILPLEFREEHHALYQQYQLARHSDADPAQNSAAQYREFLVQSNVHSVMVEFRDQDKLCMVSVVDVVGDGLSAVYTFYDCSDVRSSYGTFNVLWLNVWCQALQLPYLYLGYWIAESRKMAYKQQFQPQQGLIDGEWVPLRIAPTGK